VRPIRRNLDERDQDEPSFVQPRVRQDKCGSLHYDAMIGEKIEIEDARCISFCTDPTEAGFDRLQHREQFARPELGGYGYDGVDKPRLTGARERFASIPTGTAQDADAFVLDCSERGRQRLARRAKNRAVQISPHSDQDHRSPHAASPGLT